MNYDNLENKSLITVDSDARMHDPMLSSINNTSQHIYTHTYIYNTYIHTYIHTCTHIYYTHTKVKLATQSLYGHSYVDDYTYRIKFLRV